MPPPIRRIIPLTILVMIVTACTASAGGISLIAGYDPGARTQTTISPGDLVEREFNLHELKDRRLMAKRGDVHAAYEVGVMEQIRGNYGQAARWYRRAALFGHPLASHNLGVMYYNGLGLQLDERLAAKWVGKAADDGLAPAQFLYGIMHLLGAGVPEDPELERQWIESAALQNHALAQFHLGLIHIDGHGVPEDRVLGVAWIQLATLSDVEIDGVDVAAYLAYEDGRLSDNEKERLIFAVESLRASGLGPARESKAQRQADEKAIREVLKMLNQHH